MDVGRENWIADLYAACSVQLERFHDEATTSGYGNDTGVKCSIDAGADEHDRESKDNP